MMKHSAFFLGLVLAASPAALSQAADTPNSRLVQSAAMSSDNPTQQAAVTTAAEDSFVSNRNPLASARLASPYDQEDAFKDANGNPLPGWNLFGGDIQASGGE